MRLGGKPGSAQISVIGLEHLESPEPLRSRASHGSLRSPFERVVVSLRSTTRSLRASLALLVAVLASAVFPERLTGRAKLSRAHGAQHRERPFQSRPTATGCPIDAGGTERGRRLDEPGRRKHRRNERSE